jgi:hypothetical protein
MEKKKRDYIFLLASMILSFVGLHIVLQLGITFQSEFTQKVAEVLTFLVIVSWHIFLYRVTSNFYKSKLIRGLYAGLLIFQVCLIVFVNRQEQVAISSLLWPASIAYTCFLISFSIVFNLLLKDIFLQKHDLTYSLLGASNIYFLIPVIFSYLFSLVAVQDPTMVHADNFTIKTVLYNCSEYSWYVMAGIDYPGEKISAAIQSMAIMESISGNLFIVFIIGRLMIK